MRMRCCAISNLFLGTQRSFGVTAGRRTSWRTGSPRYSCADRLLNDLANSTRTDSPAALTNGEPQALLHSDRRMQRDLELDVIARHHHLGALRQLRRPGHVRGPEVKLRTIAVEERRMPPAFFLAQDVHLTLEHGVRRNRTRLGQHHPALHIFLRNTAQQQTGVIASET